MKPDNQTHALGPLVTLLQSKGAKFLSKDRQQLGKGYSLSGIKLLGSEIFCDSTVYDKKQDTLIIGFVLEASRRQHSQ